MAKAYDYLFKLLLIGDSGVGKTCVLLRFCDSAFSTTFISTIGIDFKIRTIDLDGRKIKLQIWDTAGQERFKTITTAYYRGAMGIMLVYDITSEKSFDNIKNWIRNIEEHASAEVERMLIGNKCDMQDKRQVSREKGEHLAMEYGIKFMETSAKGNINVDEAFLSLAKDIKAKIDKKAGTDQTGNRVISGGIRPKQDSNKKPGKELHQTMVLKVGLGDIDDLSTLNVLDEESLLRELRARYKKGVIYTYIGDVLIAINPFKQLNIYEKQQHDLYKYVQCRHQLTPHIFWIADQAYRKLCLAKRSQCIAVSGESGAGKTESTKLMVSHIIHCSGDAGDRELQNRIIETSPLLEAFGNAQTCMNQNSSRFGKYLQLNFTDAGRIIGAKVYHYLLEKSRVVQHGPGERTFHFFYYLFAGLEKETLEYFYLDDPETYRVLKDPCGGKVFPSRSDFKHCRQMFNTQKEIMRRVGFTDDDINMVFTILSAILHLTNIQFSHDDETDGVYIEDEYPLEVVCTLLALDQEILTMALISTFSITKGERVISLKNFDQANDCRDALAKALYERLFSWIVKQTNTLLQPNRRRNQTDNNIYRTCSILDMSGFENFQVNSFEQLCINVANEHLQYYFNEHIFLQEEQDYGTEGVSWEKVEFQNNEDLIELFMGPLGIFALLDEETRFPKANDESLVQKFHSHCKNHPRYIRPRGNETAFGIHHYAGKVVYDARGFLEKNRDNLSANLMECMEKSGIELIGYLFTISDDTTSISDTLLSSTSPFGMISKPKTISVYPTRRPKSFDADYTKENLSQKAAKSLRQESRPYKPNTIQKERFSQHTVAVHFKNSLAELLDKMKDAEPSFVSLKC
ncbi:unnamed protein product [Rotaria sordida]|uniref:Myosin motor domain-containing protein n=1 Tax=Rotaria sordida TaxID=392033 RepID=A0A814ALA8_9BILA|nr:unnamed protein product [Rotaria sordida]CAF0904485.1 unnamed protein product [Rotaria sordida]CAF0915050.1 unnamed protein product [Rotaria sordida]